MRQASIDISPFNSRRHIAPTEGKVLMSLSPFAPECVNTLSPACGEDNYYIRPSEVLLPPLSLSGCGSECAHM